MSVNLFWQAQKFTYGVHIRHIYRYRIVAHTVIRMTLA